MTKRDLSWLAAGALGAAAVAGLYSWRAHSDATVDAPSKAATAAVPDCSGSTPARSTRRR